MNAAGCEAHELGGCNRPGCEDSGACAARPFGMGEPMRRPSDALPIGEALLAVCFVVGFIAGSACTLLWWAEQ